MSSKGIKSYFRNTISFTLVFALICVGVIGSVWSKGVYKTRTENNKDSQGETKGYINSLLLGVDKDGYRTDVIILAQLNLVENSLSMIQIPRDTYVAINRNDKKINSAYVTMKNGKLATDINQVYKEVEHVTGISVDNFLLVDTKGFRNIIDAIGGVDFDVPQDMKYDDPTQDLHIDLKKGFQHLNGDKAEQLVRFRGYAMADLARNKVQRNFIFAVIDKVFSLGGVTKIPELISIASSSLETNFSSSQMLQYAPFIMSLDKENINIMGLEGVAEMRNGRSYFIANDKLNEEIKQKYFVDENSISDTSNLDLKKKTKLLSNENNKIVKTDFDKGVPSFFDKLFLKVQIIDGSGGTVNIDDVKNAVADIGYNVNEVYTSSVEYPSSRIISDMEDDNTNAIAKTLEFEDYIVSPSKTGNFEIVIVVGKNWNE